MVIPLNTGFNLSPYLSPYLCAELYHILCRAGQQGLNEPPHCVHHPGHFQDDDPTDEVGIVVDQHLCINA